MVGCQIEDGEFGCRQRFPQLPHPPVPRVLAPEVVSPEEAALFEVETQLRGFFVVEAGSAGFRHHHERTIEQRRIRQLDEQMVRFSGLVLADMGLGELGKAKRKIDVRARVVDAPASAVALEGVAKDDAAEMKTSVEILRRGRAGAEAKPAASTKLRV